MIWIGACVLPANLSTPCAASVLFWMHISVNAAVSKAPLPALLLGRGALTEELPVRVHACVAALRCPL